MGGTKREVFGAKFKAKVGLNFPRLFVFQERVFNHVHLLMTPNRPDSISRLMQSLGRRYAQYVNRVYRRSGGVWEGRFKASLIQAEEYLLTCYRYIELNPVRADMVNDPGEYRWSSYRWHGLGQAGETRVATLPGQMGLDL